MPASQIIRCPVCGTSNRISPEKLTSSTPLCGRCKTPLPLKSAPVAVTDATFAAIVERSPIPVLVDMWAPWCGPCRGIAPIIESLAAELTGQILVAKLNTDESPATAARFRIDSIPSLLIFKAGHEVDRLVGAHPAAAIKQHLAAVLA